MKLIFKKKNKYSYVLLNVEKNKLIDKKRGLKYKILNKWIQFYYPIASKCFYIFEGKVVRQRLKSLSLNQSITVTSKVSKEKIHIKLPLQHPFVVMKTI